MKVVARDIDVRIGARPILDGAGLAIAPGELVGLIGPNGAGKSTLLRVIAGLARPDGGTVLYDGHTGPQIGRRALARAVSFLAQGGEVNWPMRVADVVALGRLPHQSVGDRSARDCAAVEQAMHDTDVLDLRERIVSTLSGGERMRVLLARALAVEAEILLADEPIAALDPLHQLRVMDLLRAKARSGTGVAVVLHDLTLAARFCDRLVLLAHGRPVADGTPDTVLSGPHIGEAFGVVVLRGEHEGSPFVVPWRALDRSTPHEHSGGCEWK